MTRIHRKDVVQVKLHNPLTFHHRIHQSLNGTKNLLELAGITPVHGCYSQRVYFSRGENDVVDPEINVHVL